MKFIFFKDKKNIFWNLPLEQHLLILILPIIFSNLSITFKLYQLKLAVYLHWLRFLFCYFFVISFLVWFSIFFYWKFQDIHISELGFSDFCFLTYWNTAASVWIVMTGIEYRQMFYSFHPCRGEKKPNTWRNNGALLRDIWFIPIFKIPLAV